MRGIKRTLVMSMRTCPICGAKFDAKESEAPPFCSSRCKLIDLGNWLGEGYRVPDESSDSPYANGDDGNSRTEDSEP